MHDFATINNRQILKKRDEIQVQLDHWCRDNPKRPLDMPAYKATLESIGYLVPEGGDFEIATDSVDEEIGRIAGRVYRV